MRCLYCGKQLALFRRLTGGGEFCSDVHKASYQDEFNRLALDRLKQAQEKSDELRAAAPQNQLALTRRGAGEPEGPTIRSNAHWIEPKPGRSPQKKMLGIDAPATPAQPDPKPSEFIKEMPAPAQPPAVGTTTEELQPLEVSVGASKPEWHAPPAAQELSPAGQIECTLAPATAVPEPSKVASVENTAPAPAAFPFIVESRKPEWNPAVTPLRVPAGEPVGGPVPVIREQEIAPEIPAPPIMEMTTPHPSVPPLSAPQAVHVLYPSLPPVQIDRLRFAPAIEAEVEMRSQFLPFHFDFVPFPAPEFDLLEPLESPTVQAQPPRLPLKRTEPENLLDPPAPPMHIRKRSLSTQALEMGTIGEIAALATPITSLYPRLATPGELKLADVQMKADAFLSQPPATVMPRAEMNFRAGEKAPAALADDPDDKRPSTLKVKLAAMAPILDPPAAVQASKPAQAPAATPNRTPERKPVERAVPPPPARVLATPRRRTVPVPSILELPPDVGEEQKSLWGTLRKYLGK